MCVSPLAPRQISHKSSKVLPLSSYWYVCHGNGWNANINTTMSGKKDKASAEDLHVMDTVEQYESYEDYLDSQVKFFFLFTHTK